MYANTLLYISLHIKRDGEHRDCNKRCSTSNAMSGAMIFSSSLGCGSQPKWPCNNVIHTGNLGSGFRRLQRNQDMTKEFGKNTIFRYLQSSMSDYDSFEPKIIFNRSFGTFTSSNRQMGSHIMTAPRNIWSEIGLKEVVPEAPRCCKICKLLEITHLLRILRS